MVKIPPWRPCQTRIPRAAVGLSIIQVWFGVGPWEFLRSILSDYDVRSACRFALFHFNSCSCGFHDCLHFILASRSLVADISLCDAPFSGLIPPLAVTPLFLALHVAPGVGMTQGPGWPKRGVMETHNTAVQVHVRSKLWAIVDSSHSGIMPE